jgi:Flp pilus assembly pilin Flp
MEIPTIMPVLMAEYGILIAVVAIIVIVAATVLGGSISALFNTTASSV